MKTIDSKSVVATAVTTLLAVGFMTASTTASAADYEKCAGVAATGKNDCGTAVSSCAGTAKQDRDAHAWILVPKGTCSKIAGGTVTTDANNHKGGAGAK